MKWLGSLLCVFAIQGQVFAGGCRGCYAPTYYPPVYKEIIKTVVVTEYVAYPLYVATAVYLPSVAVPAVPLAPIAPVPAAVAPVVPPPQVAIPAIPVVPLVPAAPVVPVAPAVPVGAAAGQDRLLAALSRIEARLDALERQNGVPQGLPKEQAPRIKGVAALQNRCAKCHDTGTAEKSGGGFVMFEKGQMVDLSDRHALLAFKKVVKQEMPPKDEPKLSDAEGQEILGFLDSYKQKGAKQP